MDFFFYNQKKNIKNLPFLKYDKLAIIWGQKPSKDSLKFLLKINYYFVFKNIFVFPCLRQSYTQYCTSEELQYSGHSHTAPVMNQHFHNKYQSVTKNYIYCKNSDAFCMFYHFEVPYQSGLP